MADNGKRKISAKAMVADIRSGLDDSKLQRKYGLSPEALESVYTKLIKAGALKESEIRKLLAPPREEIPRNYRRDAGATKKPLIPEPQIQKPVLGTPCPSCNAPVPEGTDECPMCGIVLSKFAASQAQTAPAEHIRSSAADSEGLKKGTSVVLSFVILGLIGVILVVWAMHRDRQSWHAVSRDAAQVVEETSSAAETSEEAASEATPEGSNPDDASAAEDAGAQSAYAEEAEPAEQIREQPKRQVAHSRRPVATPPVRPSDKGKYVTGVVRRFTSRDFKKEVTDASNTYPVMFQFYSDT